MVLNFTNAQNSLSPAGKAAEAWICPLTFTLYRTYVNHTNFNIITASFRKYSNEQSVFIEDT
jgi:hypothetical protein